jgi:DNA-binding HxlR family transcriptional regulator
MKKHVFGLFELPRELQNAILCEMRMSDGLILRATCHDLKERVENALTTKQVRFLKRVATLSRFLPPSVTLERIRENNVAFHTAYDILFHRKNGIDLLDAANLVAFTVCYEPESTNRELQRSAAKKLITLCSSIGCNEMLLRHAVLHGKWSGTRVATLNTFKMRAEKMDRHVSSFSQAILSW